MPSVHSTGFADIVGRRYGVTKLPYNQQKSWVGSISMFVFGLLFSVGEVHNAYMASKNFDILFVMLFIL